MYVRALATAILGLEYIAETAERKGYGAVPNRTVERELHGEYRFLCRSLLGLDPSAKAKIMALSASTESSLAGLESLAAKGAAIRKRRQAELAKESTDEAS